MSDYYGSLKEREDLLNRIDEIENQYNNSVTLTVKLDKDGLKKYAQHMDLYLAACDFYNYLRSKNKHEEYNAEVEKIFDNFCDTFSGLDVF
jgi:hypothetical protein